jgi:phosphonopyruvate decarboxylase
MIEARDFVEAARERGFEWYAGVPCSYLTPFINYVLQDESLQYVSMANEGDAVALIAGVALAGARGIAMMQNSGLGNAVSPLTSLTWTFRLPQLLIVTWRGQPGVPDEPQHALMGPITPSVLEAMEIPWELFPSTTDTIGPALERALAHMDATGRPYALVMQKGTVAPYALKPGAAEVRGIKSATTSTTTTTPAATPRAATSTSRATSPQTASPQAASSRSISRRPAILEPVHRTPDARPSRQEALREVVAHTSASTTAVLASTGFCGRELYAIADRPNQLYMVGSMGCVVPLALGLALARPGLRVVALDGDGAALMRMGAFATVGAYGPSNLQHLLLDNGVHDSTGGQATVSTHVSFAEIAAACGYASSFETDEVTRIGAWLDAAPVAGPRFARLLTRSGTPDGLPRPSVTPVDVKTRLMQHFGPRAGVR